MSKFRYRDVGSSHPGGGEAPKGRAVRPLKRYASWVQNVHLIKRCLAFDDSNIVLESTVSVNPKIFNYGNTEGSRFWRTDDRERKTDNG